MSQYILPRKWTALVYPAGWLTECQLKEFLPYYNSGFKHNRKKFKVVSLSHVYMLPFAFLPQSYMIYHLKTMKSKSKKMQEYLNETTEKEFRYLRRT